MKGENEDWRREEFLDEEEYLRAQRPEGPTGAALFVGTSGWSYKDWEGSFYPAGIRPADYLRHYGRFFRTVEVDSTFYAIPRAEVVKNWARRSPEGFIFAAKFPRDLTHAEGGLARFSLARDFVERMEFLGPKRGPLLMQFPPGFHVERLPELARLLDILPDGPRYALEFRHADWYCQPVLELLQERNMAWVAGVGPDNPPRRPVTADFAYLRWIGDRSIDVFDRVQVERKAELSRWADWIEGKRQQLQAIYGYFNNHYAGHGPASARTLLSALGFRPATPDTLPERDVHQGDLFG